MDIHGCLCVYRRCFWYHVHSLFIWYLQILHLCCIHEWQVTWLNQPMTWLTKTGWFGWNSDYKSCQSLFFPFSWARWGRVNLLTRLISYTLVLMFLSAFRVITHDSPGMKSKKWVGTWQTMSDFFQACVFWWFMHHVNRLYDFQLILNF